MLQGKLIADAVVHAFDLGPDNIIPGRYGAMVAESVVRGQLQMMPPEYRVARERFMQTVTAEAIDSVLFAEAPIDVAVYHPVLINGAFRRGLSPLRVGLELRDRRPDRVLVYGAVTLLDGSDALAELERQVDECAIAGVKMYPVEFIDGAMRTLRMDDRELVYPMLERCLDLGVHHVAIHKAIPLGTAPSAPFDPADVASAAADFPEISFELVHSGFAFLEETCSLMDRFANVFVNLETTADLLPRYPRRFARILGEIIFWAGHERVLWGTGATGAHPAPLIQAFDQFQFTSEDIDAYGFRPLTEKVREDIFAHNLLQAHGLDEVRIRREAAARPSWSPPTHPWALLQPATTSGPS